MASPFYGLMVDVTVSGWDASLESHDGSAPAVRLGLSQLRSMHRDAAERIETARAIRSFASVKDLGRRASLDRHDVNVLAAGNALIGLTGTAAPEHG